MHLFIYLFISIITTTKNNNEDVRALAVDQAIMYPFRNATHKLLVYTINSGLR